MAVNEIRRIINMKMLAILLYIVCFYMLGSRKIGYWPPVILAGIAGGIWAIG